MNVTWDHVHRVYADAPLGIARLDLTGNVLACNDHFCYLVGRDQTGVNGLNVLRDLTKKQDSVDTEERFRLLASGEAVSISTQKHLLRPSGDAVLCQVISVAVYEESYREGPPDYIIDAVYRVESVSRQLRIDLEKLQHSFDMMRALYEQQQQSLFKSRGGVVVVNTGDNVDGNKVGGDNLIEVGGDYVGRDRIESSGSSMRWLALTFSVVVIAVAWLFYYVAMSIGGGGGDVETPKIEMLQE